MADPLQFPRWAVVETISLLIECLVFAIASNIVYLLQISIDAKAKVIFAFFTRMPWVPSYQTSFTRVMLTFHSIIAPTIVRLVYLQQTLDKADYMFGMVNAIIATQCVLHYTVMAASFSYLKPFLSAFDSNFGATVNLDTVAGSQYAPGSRNKGKSYMMKSMSRSDKVDELRTPRAADIDETRRNRTSSQDSKAPIIVKTRTFQVYTEPMAS